jgi:Mn2+/Fe2+ NRAMP family transporter
LEISTDTGCVTGRGVPVNLKQHCQGWSLYVIVFHLVFPIAINVGADFGGMAAALTLLIGGPWAHRRDQAS